MTPVAPIAASQHNAPHMTVCLHKTREGSSKQMVIVRGDALVNRTDAMFVYLIIRLFQLVFLVGTVFSLTTKQPEQCFGLFFQ